jgi:hypothetical protein
VASQRPYGMVAQWAEGAPINAFNLKGFNHPVLAVEILRWNERVEDHKKPGATLSVVGGRSVS